MVFLVFFKAIFKGGDHALEMVGIDHDAGGKRAAFFVFRQKIEDKLLLRIVDIHEIAVVAFQLIVLQGDLDLFHARYDEPPI